MNLYTGANQDEVIVINQVSDLVGLGKIFQQYGDKIAGLVTEFPTNPLLQAGDLEQVKSWCDQYNALLSLIPPWSRPRMPRLPTWLMWLLIA